MPFQFRKESIEEDLNSTFPSQGQGNPPLYYSLSEVVVPTYQINDVSGGSGIAQNLQTALDFSTGLVYVENTTSTILTTPGFYSVDLLTVTTLPVGSGAGTRMSCFIDDGATQKAVYSVRQPANSATSDLLNPIDANLVVFLRSGDDLKVFASSSCAVSVVTRQIATSTGTLVNPLGYSAA